MNSSLTDAIVPLSRISLISGNFQLITVSCALTVVTGATGVPGGITGSGRFSVVNPLVASGNSSSLVCILGFTSNARIFTAVGVTPRKKTLTKKSKNIWTFINKQP